jgi:DNA processing protein
VPSSDLNRRSGQHIRYANHTTHYKISKNCLTNEVGSWYARRLHAEAGGPTLTEDIKYWIGFSRVSGIGSVRLRALLDTVGSISAAWNASSATLRATGIDQRTIERFLALRASFNLDAEVDRVDAAAVTVLTWDSQDYPPQLKNIPNPPPVLYVKGKLLPRDEWALGVVGTRKASVYGKEATRALVHDLAASGVTIVSGLAYGIDTQAHKVALEAGGRTIAVLGSGVDIIYPPTNRGLAEDIFASGALVSDYPLGTKPDARNFPPRNRIISGLSLGVLVVEGAIKSGAMITAKYAVEQGREVFAVPGNILNRASDGPSYLIQQGAKLVTSVGDILEELNLDMVAQQTEARQILPDNEMEAQLLRFLSTEPIHVDALGRAASLPIHEVTGALTLMELKGKVRQVGNMCYVLAH